VLWVHRVSECLFGLQVCHALWQDVWAAVVYAINRRFHCYVQFWIWSIGILACLIMAQGAWADSLQWCA
jgi:hypothetical protein